ncbi:hypothetical protein COOONC_09877 [Cooperia oncophora]
MKNKNMEQKKSKMAARQRERYGVRFVEHLARPKTATMQLLKPGYYRFDILILLTYQMNHFFGVQQLFPIFLNHTPKTFCVGEWQLV